VLHHPPAFIEDLFPLDAVIDFNSGCKVDATAFEPPGRWRN